MTRAERPFWLAAPVVGAAAVVNAAIDGPGALRFGLPLAFIALILIGFARRGHFR